MAVVPSDWTSLERELVIFDSSPHLFSRQPALRLRTRRVAYRRYLTKGRRLDTADIARQLRIGFTDWRNFSQVRVHILLARCS